MHILATKSKLLQCGNVFIRFNSRRERNRVSLFNCVRYSPVSMSHRLYSKRAVATIQRELKKFRHAPSSLLCSFLPSVSQKLRYNSRWGWDLLSFWSGKVTLPNCWIVHKPSAQEQSQKQHEMRKGREKILKMENKMEMDRIIYCSIPYKWYLSLTCFRTNSHLACRQQPQQKQHTVSEHSQICHMRRRRCQRHTLRCVRNAKTRICTRRNSRRPCPLAVCDVLVCTSSACCHRGLGFYDQIREYIPFFICRRFIFHFLFLFFLVLVRSVLPLTIAIFRVDRENWNRVVCTNVQRSLNGHINIAEWMGTGVRTWYMRIRPMSCPCVMPETICVMPVVLYAALRLLSTSPSPRTLCVYSFVFSFLFFLLALFFVGLLGQRVIENDTCFEANTKWVFAMLGSN